MLFQGTNLEAAYKYSFRIFRTNEPAKALDVVVCF